MPQKLVELYCYMKSIIIFQISANVNFCKKIFQTPIASICIKIILTHTKLEAGNSSFNNHTLDRSNVELMQTKADSLVFNEENSNKSHTNLKQGELKS